MSAPQAGTSFVHEARRAMNLPALATLNSHHLPSRPFTRAPGRALVGALLVAACASTIRAQQPDSSRWSALKLWYTAPAKTWDTALPVGNGRLGAMVFGRTEHERIALNEETLWTGGPYDQARKGGYEALPEIRKLLFAGDYAKAHDLFGRKMMGIPHEQQKYQPLGNLVIDVPGADTVEDYRRVLDMDRGVVTVSYEAGGVHYTRTIFASAPDHVIVVHFSADRPGSIDFDAQLHGVRNTEMSNYGTAYFQMDGLPPDTLRLTGKNSTYLGIVGRERYEARVVVRTRGGSHEVDYRTLKVRGADEATLVIAAATNFVNYHDVSGDPAARVARTLAGVAHRSYEQMLSAEIADQRSWFRRVSIQIGPSHDDVPTDVRLARPDSQPDADMAALAYQFGRYLLIASSRPGTQPANLQGIWNDNPNPWWDSKYTTNINLEMNYWAAESANLSELTGPLFGLIDDVSHTGREVARQEYDAPGWVLHQNTDIWRAAAPMDGPSWGTFATGGAWLVTSLWKHYEFDPDRAFLEKWYPVMRGQVRFLSAILVKDPNNGWLVTAPSTSPENFPGYPGNGRFFDETSGLYLKAHTITVGSTIDISIIRTVFDEFERWSKILGKDAALRARVRAQADSLPPFQIGKHGQLQEWIEDWPEIEPHHRHLSPDWGAYPGDLITPRSTPALAKAVAVSIQRRGTGGCGWSQAWKVALWARLGNAEMAEQQLQLYLAHNVLPNLFSRCGPALQVDGSLGITAAIGDMLLQSQNDTIDILPALPGAWPEGRVSGLRARGAFTVDIAWKAGRPTEVVVRSRDGLPLRLRAAGLGHVESDGAAVPFRRTASGVMLLDTRPGTTYRFTPE